VGPGGLREIVCDLHPSDDLRRLVGFDLGDDAGVYRLDGVTLVQTIDVITPIVDDPFTFGRIAAANAMSDVYAMGGRPATALNFLAFPEGDLPAKVAADILRGGLAACEEADCALLGGHTIRDEEVKYGLAVTGVADPDKIVTNAGAKPGDVLVLTKPLGTGVIGTAVKKGVAPAGSAQAAEKSMMALNKSACEAMLAVGANACTDVTGFGLGGHAAQMASASDVTFNLYSSKMPFLKGALPLCRKEILPGGSRNNLKVYRSAIRVRKDVDPARLNLIFDAQTSGGLLISVPSAKSRKLVSELKKRGAPAARTIGEVSSKKKGLNLVIE